MVVRAGPYGRQNTKQLMPLNCGAGEDSWKSLGQQGDQTSQYSGRSTLNIHWKDWCWSWGSSILSSDANRWPTGKLPDAEKDGQQKEKKVSEDEMAGRHHWFSDHELRQTSGDGEGQGGWPALDHGVTKSQTWLNNDNNIVFYNNYYNKETISK